MCQFEISLNHMALVEIISSGFWSSQRLSERRRPACRCIPHVSRAPRLPGLGTIFRRGLGFHRSLRGTQGLQHVVPPTTGRIPRGMYPARLPNSHQTVREFAGDISARFIASLSPWAQHSCGTVFQFLFELFLNFWGVKSSKTS